MWSGALVEGTGAIGIWRLALCGFGDEMVMASLRVPNRVSLAEDKKAGETSVVSQGLSAELSDAGARRIT